jgi:TRAP-type C4-dicarboxylate transport system permease small subunit
MPEQASAAVRPTDPVGRILYDIARWLALFGGALSCAMALIVTISVIGRYFFDAPIPGDYDIVGILCGCAIFAFLPYCQFVRGNVVVDFFTNNAPDRIKSALDSIGVALYLVVIALFTWRLFYGAADLYNSHEMIAAFAFYRWTTVPFDILCNFVLLAVIAYTLSRDIRDIRSGRATTQTAVHGE